MFEIGSEYEFLTGVGATQGAWIGEVLDIALPLLRILGTRRGKDHQRCSGVVLEREAAAVSLARGQGSRGEGIAGSDKQMDEA